jgi:hypothetical protein
MINLAIRDYFELFLGFIFLWVATYILSKDPYKKLSWITFAIIVGYGITIFTDSILLQSPDVRSYTIWQKITDWPIFFAPIFYYHASLYIKKKISTSDKALLFLGYLAVIFLYIIDIKGGLILRENSVRFNDFRRIDGFEPGVMLIPSITFVCLYVSFGIWNCILRIKENFWKYFLPSLSGFFLLATGIIVAFSYHFYINTTDLLYSSGISISLLIFIYSIVKYFLLISIKQLFDKAFFIKTASIILIIIIYLLAFLVSEIEANFRSYVLVILIMMFVIFSHSFYDWFSTFVNDLIYNVSSGLSVVNDEEVCQALKNYGRPERLEGSPLMRLKVINQLVKNKVTPVDALKKILEDSVNYFKPKEEPNRRIKKNLKYQILKMMTFDESEEGQILWELGFEDYPVAIMTRENRDRKPMFKTDSPSDYFYTSRNAFIALKKEAIHDIAWRISYLEKIEKKRHFA